MGERERDYVRVGRGPDPTGQKMEKAVEMVKAGSGMWAAGGHVGCW